MTIPATLVRTSHSLSIQANGTIVGLINGWNPTQNRAATPIYEVDISSSGGPVEYMPGNVTGLNITINRYDIYNKRMEEAFGTRDLVMLHRQSEPFSVIEKWIIPERFGGGEERFIYDGCWFTSLGRTLRSDDNRIVNVNATLVYVKKQKVTGLAAPSLSLPNLPRLA